MGHGITHSVARNTELHRGSRAGDIDNAGGSARATDLCALDEELRECAYDKEGRNGIELEQVYPVTHSLWFHPSGVSGGKLFGHEIFQVANRSIDTSTVRSSW